MINSNTKTTSTGEPIVSAYLHQKSIRLGIPLSGTFELTSRCNFNCKMCYIHTSDCNKNKSMELSSEWWINLGKKARDKGMLFLLLTGGEPLIREDFFEIYSELKKLGLIISINTNGSLLKGDNLEHLLKDPPSRINITLYGASNETYSSLCGNGDFESILKAVKQLKAAGVQVVFNHCITSYNKHDLEKIYEIAKESDINVRSSAYIYPSVRADETNTGNNASRLSPEEAGAIRVKNEILKSGSDRFISKFRELSEFKSYDESCLDFSMETDDKVHCRAGKSSFWVDWKGNINPCGMIPEKVCSLLDTDFEEAWEKVRNYTNNIRLPKKCITCRLRKICNVCAAACICETGKYDLVPEYICKYTESFEKNCIKTLCSLNGET